jgi:hypothetical protein
LKLLEDAERTKRLGSVNHFVSQGACLIELALAHKHPDKDELAKRPTSRAVPHAKGDDPLGVPAGFSHPTKLSHAPCRVARQ